ncbi:MAG: TetR/AcrR family transcriptional regulator [Pseudomonadota bacterium]
MTRHEAPADGGEVPGGGQDGLRERAILDTALSLFLKRGYTDTSLARVASEARLTPAEVHRRFGTKADLLGLILDREIQRSRQPFINGVPEYESALEAARFIAQWHQQLFAATALLPLMRITISAAHKHPELRDLLVTSDGGAACQAFVEEAFKTMIKRGLFRECDARTALRHFFGMLNQALWIEPVTIGRPIEKLDEHIDSCARAFCVLYAADAPDF